MLLRAAICDDEPDQAGMLEKPVSGALERPGTVLRGQSGGRRKIQY